MRGICIARFIWLQPQAKEAAVLKLQSSAFAPDSAIPAAYTAKGSDASPPLRWSGAPPETKTYALIMHDPDAVSGDFAHWVMFNIPAARTELAEDTPHTGDLTDGCVQGRNDFDRIGYGGPNPPPGKPHRYHFELFALDDAVTLDSGVRRAAVEQAMKGHVLARAALVGTFRKRARA
jgi:Raf kinase inhibitor-like YbhB/YbcL family protein